MRSKTIIISIILLITLSMLLAACGSKGGSSATQPSGSSTTADGQTLMNTRCNKCHSLDRVTSAHKTADQWNQTVTKMISNGAQLTSDEQKVLVDYLAKTYGP
jgi:cytochrome c-type biogenesis protein CcmH/NrfF